MSTGRTDEFRKDAGALPANAADYHSLRHFGLCDSRNVDMALTWAERIKPD
jgi:hypothetical protein